MQRPTRIDESPGGGVAAGAFRRSDRRMLGLGIARTVLSVVGVLVVYYLLPLNRPFDALTLLALAAGLVAVTLLVAWQIRAIARSPVPAMRAVEAIAVSLGVFLLLFAATYDLLAATDPHAFTQRITRTDSIYFVVTVFATVGFGDIAPVSETARVLTTVQMIGDLVLIGLGLRAILMAVDRSRKRDAGTRLPPDGPA